MEELPDLPAKGHLPDFPRYTSHRTVAAFKIMEVTRHTAGAKVGTLTVSDGTGFEADVTEEWLVKHSPGTGDMIVTALLGGYFIAYPDGYASWSPAKSFEDGYTRDGEDEGSHID